MKKLLLLIFIATIALRSSALAYSNISCDCGNNTCSCFIQMGDQGGFVAGVIRLLQDQGYCGERKRRAVFDGEILDAVIRFQADHGLPETGTLDDNTLTLLIHGMLPDQMDLAFPFSDAHYEWVPTDGGIKRHCIPDCHNNVFIIYNPRKVSIRNAEALGYTACKVCHKLVE